MKKIIIVLCCIMAILTCIAVPCFATEAESAEDTVDIAPDVETAEHTLFTRIWEFVGQYKGEVFTIIGDISLIAYAVYIKVKNGKGAKEINAALNKIKEETGLSLNNQAAVVDVINKMIDSVNDLTAEYERMKSAYEQYGATEIERNKVIGVLAAEIATVLEILATVYVNNRNLPQGVKDLVTVKYASCLKALENDTVLLGIVEAVHAALCGECEKSENPKVTEG